MTIYFYSSREKPYGCFSNFSPHGFELEGAWWPTSEHYFQAHKFARTPYADQVRQARTASEAAKLGRQRSHPFRPDWEQVKDQVMLQALLCKFQTHADIRVTLLATGDEELVENAPKDYYWGCGADGSGQNMLGKLLMNVRTILRNQEAQERDFPSSSKSN